MILRHLLQRMSWFAWFVVGFTHILIIPQIELKYSALDIRHLQQCSCDSYFNGPRLGLLARCYFDYSQRDRYIWYSHPLPIASRGYILNMTIPQPEPSPKPEVPDPEAESQEEAAKKEREDGTNLGEQREPA